MAKLRDEKLTFSRFRILVFTDKSKVCWRKQKNSFNVYAKDIDCDGVEYVDVD